MRFVFGDYVLDPVGRELRHGAALVELEPQVFDILLHLIRNRDRVVSKDDLLGTVWQGRIVSDSTISSRIAAVRRAVGDSAGQQQFIRTVARRGIRFVGDVRETGGPQAAAPAESATEVAGTPSRAAPHQSVTFCRTTDGVNLAVAREAGRRWSKRPIGSITSSSTGKARSGRRCSPACRAAAT
jgi:DNA-binding winged helix-turn-helix (wHTH) protein